MSKPIISDFGKADAPLPHLKTTLTFTDESLVNGHGFVTIDFDGYQISSRCWVELRDKLDYDADQEIERLVLDESGHAVREPVVGFIFDNGGGKEFDPCLATFFSEYKDIFNGLGAIILEQNHDFFIKILEKTGETARIYPKRIEEAFHGVVLTHMRGLDKGYWRRLRTHRGRVLFKDKAMGKMLSPEEVCRRYLYISGSPISEFVGDKGIEIIGKVEGQPVYFDRSFGIYAYAGHPDAWHTLDIWITGSTYPPGY
ncbi:MAG: hypothetical protein WC091_02020 [Sulfuricellaceae bacterium]